MTQPEDVQIYEVDQIDVDTLRFLTKVTLEEFTDHQLAEVIVRSLDEDGSTNMNRAATNLFEGMAASYAKMVDVSESGSSRSMSQLHKNALTMAALFRARLPVAETAAPVEPVVESFVTIGMIERP